MKFDLTPREEKVTIGENEYTIREASVDACDRYLDAVAACYEYGENGAIKNIKGLPATASLLLSLCMTNGDGQAVDQKTVKSWPRRIQQVLFKKAKEICDVDRDVTLPMLLEQRKDIDRRIKALEQEEELLKNSSARAGGGSP